MSTLVIGEALIDVTEDRRTDPPVVAEHVGGSPANVALGLARLSATVELLTSIGRDAHGELIAATLADSGVRLHPASWSASQTSVARAVIDGASGSASYRFDLSWQLAEVPDLLIAGVTSIVHAGSIASYLRPGAAVVRRVLGDARRAGLLVTYDPNVRGDLIRDAESAREDMLAAMRRAHVVKLSDEDLLWLYPEGVEEALRSILDLGPDLVVVTAGPGGSIMATRAGWITVPSDRVDVADTIGAGDSYMATLIAELRHRVIGQGGEVAALGFDELAAIGARCARAASITVSRPGADPPTLAEVLALEIDA